MTFYLKYRPKTIDELDLTSARERLSRIVKQGKYAHAYLFSGPRGTGKTSAARIVAREAGAVGVDIIEMDAASNRGIDDIRELRERVGLSPAEGERKVYIIDEVHMLTTEAFNALLKTLEEPPSHVMFFLCTTELEKVPKTVVSRCVHIPFSKATSDEVMRALSRTAKGEKLKVSDEALVRIASIADGSFREAQSVLEEAVSENRKDIELADVERVIGGSISGQISAYVDGIINGTIERPLAAIAHVVDAGGNIAAFSKGILEELRRRLLAQPDARLLDVIKIVEERTRTVKYSLLPQLPLEIAVMELNKDQGPRAKGQEKQQKQEERRETDDAPTINHHSSAISLDTFLSHWPMILSGVKEKNHGIIALLSHCQPTGINGSSIVLEVGFKFHKEQLEQARFRKIIEQVIDDVCGSPLGIQIHLTEQTDRKLKQFGNDDTIRTVSDADMGLASAAEEIFSI